MSLQKKPISAIAVFNGKIKGIVKFKEDLVNSSIIIDIQLSGLKKNAAQGFHVHQSGDLSEQCESLCAHFNPYKKNHGCPGMKDRHVGDLGNLMSDKNGNVNIKMSDNFIKLRGSLANIIGRGLIIHADEDDCGLGINAASKVNGNAGKRVACAIIGYSKENFC